MKRWWLLLPCCLVMCAASGQSLLGTKPAVQPAPSLLRPVVHAPSLPALWRYEELGVFCKLDVQLERRMRLPLRFRLSDPWQVDRLEGKGPLHMPRDH